MPLLPANTEGKKVQKPAQMAPVIHELFEPSMLPQPKETGPSMPLQLQEVDGGILDAGLEAQALPKPAPKPQVQQAVKRALMLTARPPAGQGSKPSAADARYYV